MNEHQGAQRAWTPQETAALLAAVEQCRAPRHGWAARLARDRRHHPRAWSAKRGSAVL